MVLYDVFPQIAQSELYQGAQESLDNLSNLNLETSEELDLSNLKFFKTVGGTALVFIGGAIITPATFVPFLPLLVPAVIYATAKLAMGVAAAEKGNKFNALKAEVQRFGGRVDKVTETMLSIIPFYNSVNDSLSEDRSVKSESKENSKISDLSDDKLEDSQTSKLDKKNLRNLTRPMISSKMAKVRVPRNKSKNSSVEARGKSISRSQGI